MLGTEFRQIRWRLQMNRLQFARILGYTGTDRNDVMRMRKYEGDKQQIPLYVARWAWLLVAWFDLTGQIPQFPDWPGYDFDHAPDDHFPLPDPEDGVLS